MALNQTAQNNGVIINKLRFYDDHTTTLSITEAHKDHAKYGNFCFSKYKKFVS